MPPIINHPARQDVLHLVEDLVRDARPAVEELQVVEQCRHKGTTNGPAEPPAMVPLRRKNKRVVGNPNLKPYLYYMYMYVYIIYIHIRNDLSLKWIKK